MPTIKLKIKNGFHIPLEICEDCSIRKQCLSRDEKETELVNKRRRKLIDYIKAFGGKYITIYQNPYEMYEKLGIFINSLYDNSDTFDYSDRILYINTERRALQIIFITHDAELMFIGELEKTNKIGFVVKAISGQYE